MPNAYAKQEAKILKAIEAMNSLEKPNIVAFARKYEVSEQLLRRRWKGQPSKSTRPPTRGKLFATQELAIYQCLYQLNAIETSARQSMLARSANSILAKSYLDSTILPPTAVAIGQNASLSSTLNTLSVSRRR